MAGATRTPPTSLEGELLARGHEFSFFQAMRLLQRLSADSRGEDNGTPSVRVRSELSLDFPAADVAKIEREDDGYRITARFLGLYGPSSPLPTFYTEELIDEAREDSSASRDFLDVLSQQIYALTFSCWSKHRTFLKVAEKGDPSDLERLHCLVGLTNYPLIRYAGLFGHRPRSGWGLETLLRDALGEIPITVVSCLQRTVPVPLDQRLRLGVPGSSLGINSVVGSENADRMGKFRLQIGPLSLDRFTALLPGAPDYQRLTELTDSYQADPLVWDIELILGAGEGRTACLGSPLSSRLGWNSWITSYDALEEVRAVFPAVRDPSRPVSACKAAADFSVPSERSHYQDELAQLKELIGEYVDRHPELAPMLDGTMADPDVERLLEGAAFLCGQLRETLVDDYSEIIHSVMRETYPELLQPVPAATIIAFAPKPSLKQSQIIPRGTRLASKPVDGEPCTFTTSWDVEIHPVKIIDAAYDQPAGRTPRIILHFELNDLRLVDWHPKSLCLFLSETREKATDLYLLLARFVTRIVMTPLDDGTSASLDPVNLRPTWFSPEQSLLVPSASHHFVGQRLVEEYFILPEKHLFLELTGWDQWRDRGEGTRFKVAFELDSHPLGPPAVSRESFSLFSTPAVNLFPHQSEPIEVVPGSADHHLVRPQRTRQCQVYSVDGATGAIVGSARRVDYPAFSPGKSAKDVPSYLVTVRENTLNPGYGVLIATINPPATSDKIKVTARLTCSNGSLPERLKAGDICVPTSTSPEYATFRNLSPPTAAFTPPLGANRLWRFLAALSPAPDVWDNPENLRAVLQNFLAGEGRDVQSATVNRKRVDGIIGVKATPTNRLIGTAIARGLEIRLALNRDNYSSLGDLFLFGSMLEQYCAAHCSGHCFTRMVVEVTPAAMTFEWPMRMGRRVLL